MLITFVWAIHCPATQAANNYIINKLVIIDSANNYINNKLLIIIINKQMSNITLLTDE